MKKKVLSALLAAAMAATMVAGCGGSSSGDNGSSTTDSKTTTDDKKTDDTKTDDTKADSQAADSGDNSNAGVPSDLGSGKVTIWVAENIVDFTKEKAEGFMKDNGYNYEVDVQAVGEGDAASNMITDVQGGADVFGFAQDQLARLVAAGAVTPLQGTYADYVTTENDEGSSASAQVGGTAYAFPLTSDNGYFMYYDKSVVTDPNSLEKIVADCEAAKKNFYFEVNSGWYQTAFFFGTGAKLEYTTDESGAFTDANVSYASPEGVVAMREILELASSKNFQNGSSVDNGTDIGAIVSGTWDAGAAKKAFGDNYACAKLPQFEGSDGKTYQLGGFTGYKLLGVKPQTEEGKAYVCLELAKYLTSSEVQVARYTAVGWGPSNKTAQQDATVQADEALTALRDQIQYDLPQGQYPGDYWTLATSLGDDVLQGKLTKDSSDDDIMKALTTFQTTCLGYAGK